MNADTLLESFEILAEAPYGISRLRLLIVELAIRGRFSNLEKIDGNGFPSSWDYRPASDFFKSRSGNSKLIKGKLFNEFAEGRYPGYSASGQDVWLDSAEHSGEAAILSAVGARCGKAFRASGSWSAIANTHIIWLNDKRVVPDYGMLILNNEKFWIRSGSAQPFVKVKASLEQKIGIPPLVEQRRIVTKVNELMALCDQLEKQQKQRDNIRTATRKSAIDAISTATTPEELETAWMRISENWGPIFDSSNAIRQLRQLILDLAVRGRLVAQCDEEGSGQQFIQRFRCEGPVDNETGKQFNKPFAIPPNWVWAAFGEVSSNRDSERVPLSQSQRANRKGPYDYYGASGVIDSIDDYLFDQPLLLIGEDGANLVNRNTPIAFVAAGKYWVNNHAHVIDSFDVDALHYLALVINQMNLKPFLTGTAQPKLNQGKLNQLPVPVPPHQEQARIVKRVRELFGLCEQLEQQLDIRTEMCVKFAEAVVSAA